MVENRLNNWYKQKENADETILIISIIKTHNPLRLIKSLQSF